MGEDPGVAHCPLPFLRCPECSYDLHGLDAPPRCPECGAELPEDHYDLPCTGRTKGSKGWWVILGTGAGLVGLTLLTGTLAISLLPWLIVAIVPGALAWQAWRRAQCIRSGVFGCLRVAPTRVDVRLPGRPWDQYMLREFRELRTRRRRGGRAHRVALLGGSWTSGLGPLEPQVRVEIYCDEREAVRRLDELERRWRASHGEMVELRCSRK